jgi:hypothetical protein
MKSKIEKLLLNLLFYFLINCRRGKYAGLTVRVFLIVSRFNLKNKKIKKILQKLLFNFDENFEDKKNSPQKASSNSTNKLMQISTCKERKHLVNKQLF